MLNLGYPTTVLEAEKRPTIEMHGKLFAMTVGDMCRWDESVHQVASKTVIYTDSETGKNYTVESIAFSQNQEISRFLYINGKLISIATFWHASSDNPLFSHCSQVSNAVLWALAHAESLVDLMSFNDAQVWSKEYNAWLDSIASV